MPEGKLKLEQYDPKLEIQRLAEFIRLPETEQI